MKHFLCSNCTKEKKNKYIMIKDGWTKHKPKLKRSQEEQSSNSLQEEKIKRNYDMIKPMTWLNVYVETIISVKIHTRLKEECMKATTGKNNKDLTVPYNMKGHQISRSDSARGRKTICTDCCKGKQRETLDMISFLHWRSNHGKVADMSEMTMHQSINRQEWKKPNGTI